MQIDTDEYIQDRLPQIGMR